MGTSITPLPHAAVTRLEFVSTQKLLKELSALQAESSEQPSPRHVSIFSELQRRGVLQSSTVERFIS